MRPKPPYKCYIYIHVIMNRKTWIVKTITTLYATKWKRTVYYPLPNSVSRWYECVVLSYIMFAISGFAFWNSYILEVVSSLWMACFLVYLFFTNVFRINCSVSSMKWRMLSSLSYIDHNCIHTYYYLNIFVCFDSNFTYRIAFSLTYFRCTSISN